jgi:hypothetical protein
MVARTLDPGVVAVELLVVGELVDGDGAAVNCEFSVFSRWFSASSARLSPLTSAVVLWHRSSPKSPSRLRR